MDLLLTHTHIIIISHITTMVGVTTMVDTIAVGITTIMDTDIDRVTTTIMDTVIIMGDDTEHNQDGMVTIKTGMNITDIETDQHSIIIEIIIVIIKIHVIEDIMIATITATIIEAVNTTIDHLVAELEVITVEHQDLLHVREDINVFGILSLKGFP